MLSAITANIKQQSTTSSDEKHSFTLYQLTRVLEPHLCRLDCLDAITESCAQLKGGMLINEVFKCTRNGNEAIRTVFCSLMESLAGRLLHIIDQWIYDGHLDDHYQEFFIAVNPLVRPDMLWFDRFQLRRSMLPSFISFAQSKKILVTGKSVSFLREVCKENSTLKHWDCIRSKRVKDPKTLYLNSQDQYLDAFDTMISSTYAETCRFLLDVLMNRFKLRHHFSAIRRRFLALPSNKLNDLFMVNCLQGAIEDCPELQKEPTDILDRISTELISISPEDSGWDVFTLVYQVNEGPLCTIFSKECMMMYRIIFNFLWRVRRIDLVLWQLSEDSHPVLDCGSGLSIELEPIFYLVHQFRNEADNFMRCLNHYIYIDVLETHWSEFGASLDDSADLDDVINLHQGFLDRIMTRFLLAKHFCQLAAHLRKVFDTIIEFQDYFGQFAEYMHKHKGDHVETCPSAKWSKVYKIDRKDYDMRRRFVDKTKSEFGAKFSILRNFFKKSLIAFMLKLENENDEIFLNLVDQINLNGYYDEDMKDVED
ncbi:Gamma-tubulin complex component 3 [Cichlidogyrus casuarinus]|uniref:Gamma-tubulin complex component 3 n=1 Tax=Cichlidogyrus casuarinus TaxID=1844966 RepID=A0ABD2QGP5_9PLAT